MSKFWNWLNYQNTICSYSIKLLHWREVRNEGIYSQVYEQSQWLNVLTTISDLNIMCVKVIIIRTILDRSTKRTWKGESKESKEKQYGMVYSL